MLGEEEILGGGRPRLFTPWMQDFTWVVHICFTRAILGGLRSTPMRKDALPRRPLLMLALAATLVLALAATLVLAAGSASASYASLASSAVYAENRSQPRALDIKSHGFYDNVSVHSLQWTNWGQPTASARGIFTFQFCVHESCSVSPFYDEPVSVSLSQIKPCRARLSYTVLRLNVEGPLPDQSFKAYQTSLAACRPQSSAGRRKHR